jgi:hypothetical protein
MRHWYWGLAILLATAACTTAASPSLTPADPLQETEAHPMVKLNNYGPAPELTNDVWLNTDAPLRLADLRGKVVLIDFWTFG